MASFTNVDKGVLAANWQVVTSPSRAGFNPGASNKTRQPNASSIVALQVVDGKKTFYIINKTPYASYVNNGTKRIRPYRFVERAILQTQLELKKQRITIQRIA